MQLSRAIYFRYKKSKPVSYRVLKKQFVKIVLKANLYFDNINFYKYLPQTDCKQCGFNNCLNFLKKMRTDERLEPKVCPHLSVNMAYAFNIALNAYKVIPEIELMQLPIPGKPGLVEINMPDENSPLLISGNSELTQTVISAIFTTTIKSFYLLFIDTRGDTVDMAAIHKTFTAEGIKNGIENSRIVDMAGHREMVIPGFAGSLKEEIKQVTGWNVNIGPLCCGELPLYFGEDWVRP
jgi:CO dehydrogenase/acetyl-CoA synthase gamma subunit (corrinoid Fe-S protein)